MSLALYFELSVSRFICLSQKHKAPDTAEGFCLLLCYYDIMIFNKQLVFILEIFLLQPISTLHILELVKETVSLSV